MSNNQQGFRFKTELEARLPECRLEARYRVFLSEALGGEFLRPADIIVAESEAIGNLGSQKRNDTPSPPQERH